MSGAITRGFRSLNCVTESNKEVEAKIRTLKLYKGGHLSLAELPQGEEHRLLKELPFGPVQSSLSFHTPCLLMGQLELRKIYWAVMQSLKLRQQ